MGGPIIDNAQTNPLYKGDEVRDSKRDSSAETIKNACISDLEFQNNSSSKELSFKHKIMEFVSLAKNQLSNGAGSIKDLGKQVGNRAKEAAGKVAELASQLINKKSKESDEFVINENELKWHAGVPEGRMAELPKNSVLSGNASDPSGDVSVLPDKDAETPEPLPPMPTRPPPEAKRKLFFEKEEKLAAKWKEIRARKQEGAERGTFKEELKKTRESSNPAVQKAVEESDKQIAKGRYKQEVVKSLKFSSGEELGIYKVGKYETVDGKKVYSAPKSEIKLDAIKKIAANLIKANDRAGLRKLCNSIFIGPHGYGHQESLPELNALRILLNDPESNLEGAEEMIVKGAEEWRKIFQPATANTEEGGKAIMNKPSISSDPYGDGEEVLEQKGTESSPERTQIETSTPDWAKDPEALVKISHGGGAENIRDFIEGRSDGYKLENFGTGIQVSPDSNARDNGYAQGGAYKRFDVPAVFKGEIKAKYLQRAPNSYEAGLTPENVQYLENVRVERAPFTGGTIGNPSNGLKEKGYGDKLVKEVEASYARLDARKKRAYSDEELKRIGADYKEVTKYTKNKEGKFISDA